MASNLVSFAYEKYTDNIHRDNILVAVLKIDFVPVIENSDLNNTNNNKEKNKKHILSQPTYSSDSSLKNYNKSLSSFSSSIHLPDSSSVDIPSFYPNITSSFSPIHPPI
jgi:hypothetical protein